MFDVDSWVYGKNKKYETELEKPTIKSISVISGITENNGTNYYTEDNLPENEIFEDELTISTRGIYSGTVFYHDEKFVLANNILVMKMPNLTKNQKMFVGSLINSLPYGGYSGYPRKETLEQNYIQLPTKNGEIDFEFMEEFIAELEAERVAELETYLSATGLKDYELTKEEQKILQDFEDDKIEFGEFEYDEIFKVLTVKNKLSKSDLENNSKIPVFSSESTNNGIIGYTNKEAEFLIDEKNAYYLVFGDHTRSFNLAKENFCVADNVKVLELIENYSINMILCVIASWKKCIPNMGYSRHWSIAKEVSFNLPISQNQQPNYAIMETFISAIQKLVIKDVVLYADSKIATTKKVVEKEV